MVNVTYDQNEKHGLVSRDFVFITRLDTKFPKIIIPIGGRNIQLSTADELFNKYLRWYKTTLEMAKDNGASVDSEGRCGILVDQPVDGY